MNRTLARWTAAALVAIAAGACRPHPNGPSIRYRLVAGPGAPLDAASGDKAVAALDRRFEIAGYAGIAVESSETPDELTVTLPKELAGKQDAICALAERTVTLEFRIEAEALEERKQRELYEASGGMIKPPPEFMWVPRKAGGPDMLVCTPERPLRIALDKLMKKGVAEDSDAMQSAVEKYDEAVRDNVFTGDQLDHAECQSLRTKDVVYFAFKRSRRSDFARFTEKHVRENLAIILDGKVDSAPVVNCKLPGEGIIEGGGPTGFTANEAATLAALLASGSLPGRLVRVPPPEKK